jgi:hypothetical protein
MKTTRSAFARTALREAIKKYEVRRQEEKRGKGDERYREKADECNRFVLDS